uniref:PX domain-containing protein n=1 Tax=Phaeomonas parva TaxID=124430 RepID=A0A7S1U6S8_9STRA|mmetsp:Transcript_34307/g.108138  ORF Transcript_34307/g.108138 Transcript_34307/m.108138 type:complete len:514 (+) Transcript_34307:353-1894(+)|eukprot:CAMPEP_0118875620 /NCGR_PEP_ID=MMETSP1163-20130328/16626_1 /TAXON_ID=124430 /ORGANISM="Phaeomonas parva, Strain CCMP2877" /LENGTH=513 /DNA_ID=CAMNT_0006811139 /DNA_START=190 /DNA_END=1731 /DNA_ORIENTATION=+
MTEEQPPVMSPVFIIMFILLYYCERFIRHQEAEEKRRQEGAKRRSEDDDDDEMPTTLLSLHLRSWALFAVGAVSLIGYRASVFISELHPIRTAAGELAKDTLLKWSVQVSPPIAHALRVEALRSEKCLELAAQVELDQQKLSSPGLPESYVDAALHADALSAEGAKGEISALKARLSFLHDMQSALERRIDRRRCVQLLPERFVVAQEGNATKHLHPDLVFKVALKTLLPDLAPALNRTCEAIYWERQCCEGQCVGDPPASYDALIGTDHPLWRLLTLRGSRHLDFALNLAHKLCPDIGLDPMGIGLLSVAAAMAVVSASTMLLLNFCMYVYVPSLILIFAYEVYHYRKWIRKKLLGQQDKKRGSRKAAKVPLVGTAAAQGWLQEQEKVKGKVIVAPVRVDRSQLLGGPYVLYEVKYVPTAKSKVSPFYIKTRYSTFLTLDEDLSNALSSEPRLSGLKPNLPPKRFWKNSDLVISERIELLSAYVGMLIFQPRLFNHDLVQSFLYDALPATTL